MRFEKLSHGEALLLSKRPSGTDLKCMEYSGFRVQGIHPESDHSELAGLIPY